MQNRRQSHNQLLGIKDGDSSRPANDDWGFGPIHILRLATFVLVKKVPPSKLLTAAVGFFALSLVWGWVVAALTGADYIKVISMQHEPYRWAFKAVSGGFMMAVGFFLLFVLPHRCVLWLRGKEMPNKAVKPFAWGPLGRSALRVCSRMASPLLCDPVSGHA